VRVLGKHRAPQSYVSVKWKC